MTDRAAVTGGIAENMNPCHWAQWSARVAIGEASEKRPTAGAGDILPLRHSPLEELERLQDLFDTPGTASAAWKERQGVAFAEFHACRPSRALAGGPACTPSKAASALHPPRHRQPLGRLFPALRAIGTGRGEKLFYLTAWRLDHRQDLCTLPGVLMCGVTRQPGRSCAPADAEEPPACYAGGCVSGCTCRRRLSTLSTRPLAVRATGSSIGGDSSWRWCDDNTEPRDASAAVLRQRGNFLVDG